MAYNSTTERLISIKKLAGKAQTSNDKGLANEGLPSGLTVSYDTVFGEQIPTSPTSNNLYDRSGIGTGQVEYVRFPATFIAGSDTASGRHGFELKLPSDYESNSSNPLKGTYPFKNNQSINITSGSLQLIPPSFSTSYEAKPYHGGSGTKNSGTQIPVLDARDWYMDYFNGIFFQQDPPGSVSDNPDYVEAYLFIGKYLSASLAEAGGGSNAVAGSDTQVQFNDGGSAFGASANFTFNKTTNTVKTNNLTGSLTKLADGTSYLVAGNSISITSQSNGSILLSAPNFVFNELVSGAANGTNTKFTLSKTPTANKNVSVFVNGQLQTPATAITGAPFQDYSVTGSVVFFTTASMPPEGSIMMANYTTNDNVT